MKSKPFIAVAAVFILVCVCLFYFKRHFYIRVCLEKNATVLWNDHEAFMFVCLSHSGMSSSRAGLFLKSVMWYPKVDKKREDLVVFHLTNGVARKIILGRFGGSAAVYPVQGVVYLEEPTNHENWPSLWRWDGANFQKLRKEDALLIVNTVGLITQRLEKERWKEGELWLDSGNGSLSIRLGSEGFELAFHEDSFGGRNIRHLSLRNVTASVLTESLIETPDSYEEVSAAAYSAAFREAGTNSALNN